MSFMQVVLGELIPALMAAGWSEARIRAMADEAMRRMGPGGKPSEWTSTLVDLISESRDEVAIRAATIAFQEVEKIRSGRTDA